MAVRELCLRRWPDRTVDARTVILAAATLCDTERMLWDALYELTGPPPGVAQIVASPRHLVLSIGSEKELPSWNIGEADALRLGAVHRRMGSSERLYLRALRVLRRRGVDTVACHPENQELFWREPADEWRLVAATQEERLHPELRSALETIQGIYAQAATEADSACQKERGIPPGPIRLTVAEFERWHDLEEQTRRRLIGLVGNRRLAAL